MFVLKRILQRSFSVSKGVNLSKGLRKLLKEELVHEKTTHFQDKSIEDSLKELEYSLIEKNESNIIELRKELDDYLFIINVEARKPEKLDLEEETQIEKGIYNVFIRG